MIYQQWRERLIDALDPRYYPADWLDWIIEQPATKSFIGARSCAVAELIEYPAGTRDVHVICAAGDAIDARDMIVPQLEQWARQAGALAILVTSREAWTRILKPVGFETYKTAIRKEVDHG